MLIEKIQRNYCCVVNYYFLKRVFWISAFLILMLFWGAKVEREARFSFKMSFSFKLRSFKISEIRIRSRFLSKRMPFVRLLLQQKIAKVVFWAFFLLARPPLGVVIWKINGPRTRGILTFFENVTFSHETSSSISASGLVVLSSS